MAPSIAVGTMLRLLGTEAAPPGYPEAAIYESPLLTGQQRFDAESSLTGSSWMPPSSSEQPFSRCGSHHTP